MSARSPRRFGGSGAARSLNCVLKRTARVQQDANGPITLSLRRRGNQQTWPVQKLYRGHRHFLRDAHAPQGAVDYIGGTATDKPHLQARQRRIYAWQVWDIWLINFMGGASRVVKWVRVSGRPPGSPRRPQPPMKVLTFKTTRNSTSRQIS